MANAHDETATFGAVFRVGEFRALWTALVLSIAGDQLARVALSLLVYARTNSAALTALTYALTFVPDIVGGPLLSGLADRYPRREVMVFADASRAVLVALMAVPGMPLVLVGVLLVIVQLFASPFNAARGAVLPAMLDGDLFVAGNAIFNITYQTGLVAGYLVGGELVAATGPQAALLIDAATFVASALLVRFGMRYYAVPAAGTAEAARQRSGNTLGSLRDGLRLVWQDRTLRALIGLACVCGFYLIPEGLAVPLSHELGGGAPTAGLLFAALPAGTALGMFGLIRLVPPASRNRILGPMALLSCALLIFFALHPDLLGTVVLLVATGIAASYQTVAATTFLRAVPDPARGQALGLANTSLRAAQGLGVLAAGGVAQTWPPSLVIVVFGAVGTVFALAMAVAYARSRQEPVDAVPRPEAA